MQYNTPISIIIPVCDNEKEIDSCLRHLLAFGREAEIIVIDGQSEDSTVAIAQDFPVRVFSSERGRATQLNLGARKAGRDILYFVNPNSRPPESFVEDIYSSFLQGYEGGCFKINYKGSPWFMKAEAWMSGINMEMMGAADQSLFLFKSRFLELGGYDESMGILEDFDLVSRIKKKGEFKIVPNEIAVYPPENPENPLNSGKFTRLLASQMYRLGYKSEMLRHAYLNTLRKLK